ncbi:TatD family hydrolase [Methanocaldococcus sp.]
MIDTHIHSDTRGLEDLELMAICLDAVITLAHDPFEMKNVKVWEAHVEKLLINELKRAKKVGLNLFICVGVHPRAIPPEIDEALNKIKNEYVKYDKVVGIGEIGLEKNTKEEKEVFIKQLKLAEELNMPVVVHTPRRNKEEITKIILEEIDTLNLKNKNIVIEHCNKETTKWVLDNDYYVGLTIQPGKLTPLETVEIVKENKDFADKILLNSDCSSNASDVLAVPRTVLKMKINNIKKDIINKVSHNNAVKIFNKKDIK